jgi:hypothetical protein
MLLNEVTEGFTAWTPYMTVVSAIIAKNQITNGGPSTLTSFSHWLQYPFNTRSPVILVQAENEYSASASNNIYMQAIIDLYRANGIVVRMSLRYLKSSHPSNRSFQRLHTMTSMRDKQEISLQISQEPMLTSIGKRC